MVANLDYLRRQLAVQPFEEGDESIHKESSHGSRQHAQRKVLDIPMDAPGTARGPVEVRLKGKLFVKKYTPHEGLGPRTSGKPNGYYI